MPFATRCVRYEAIDAEGDVENDASVAREELLHRRAPFHMRVL